FFFLSIPPPPRSSLFPYTTLFRSRWRCWYQLLVSSVCRWPFILELPRGASKPFVLAPAVLNTPISLMPRRLKWRRRRIRTLYPRSEEHTSELQSLAYLVCRLLLEK